MSLIRSRESGYYVKMLERRNGILIHNLFTIAYWSWESGRRKEGRGRSRCGREDKLYEGIGELKVVVRKVIVGLEEISRLHFLL